MATSFLEKDLGGLYNPSFRFAFTNISDEDFTSYWDKIPIVVKPHETIELSSSTPIIGAGMGHTLAIKMTGELVDKIIIEEGRKDSENNKNIPYYKSPKVSDLGIPAKRKVYEDQILRQLDVDEESPAIQTMRKEMLKELTNEVKPNKEPMIMPASVQEFADATNPITTSVKKPAKTKKIE